MPLIDYVRFHADFNTNDHEILFHQSEHDLGMMGIVFQCLNLKRLTAHVKFVSMGRTEEIGNGAVKRSLTCNGYRDRHSED